MSPVAFSILFVICLAGQQELISVGDAELVLGQRARLMQNFEEEKNGTQRLNTNYIGVADTSAHLYSLSARYSSAPAAHTAYAAFVAGNSPLSGFEKITNLGDEAFLHTDNLHFYLIIFRKGDKMVTLKVNRISIRTSVAELRKIAGKVDREL